MDIPLTLDCVEGEKIVKRTLLKCPSKRCRCNVFAANARRVDGSVVLIGKEVPVTPVLPEDSAGVVRVGISPIPYIFVASLRLEIVRVAVPWVTVRFRATMRIEASKFCIRKQETVAVELEREASCQSPTWQPVAVILPKFVLSHDTFSC